MGNSERNMLELSMVLIPLSLMILLGCLYCGYRKRIRIPDMGEIVKLSEDPIKFWGFFLVNLVLGFVGLISGIILVLGGHGMLPQTAQGFLLEIFR